MYFLYISLCPLFLYVYLHRKKYYLKDKAALTLLDIRSMSGKTEYRYR